MGKFKFNVGDKLGPLNMELLSRTRKNARNEWFGEFVCPQCNQQFEGMISRIASGHTKSCGCLVKAQDIANQRFGRLIALYPIGKRANGTTIWHCRCDCGVEKDIDISSLNNGSCQSCGCLRSDLKALDITHQKFGHLLAIKRTTKDVHNYFLWECLCDCGRIVEIAAHSLVSGNTQTCGRCSHQSLQEEKIAFILQELQIHFEQEKTFIDCINPETGRQLRFDFYLPDCNLIIEYDGEQHFFYGKGENTWNNKQNYEQTRYRDILKNNYCLSKNIRLIRIPYTQKTLLSKEYIKNLIDMKLTHERIDAEE